MFGIPGPPLVQTPMSIHSSIARAATFGFLLCLVPDRQAAAQESGPPLRDVSDYTLETGFFNLPEGRRIGATSGFAIHPEGDSIWVFDRCGANNCVGSDLDPVMGFDLDGNLLTSFGRDLFVRPHGLYVDDEGNIWVTDDEGPNGTDPRRDGKGHQVFKFSPGGELLMTLGKAGVAGDGPDEFNRPSAVIVAPNGDIFVGDGHGPGSNARIVKFDSDGGFIKTWGQRGTGPGEFDVPHALAFDSQGRLFVGDRGNNRVQIFDQDGNFIDSWTQFGRPSGMFIDANDLLYVADSSSTPNNNPGFEEGIRVGSARDGRIAIFLEDHAEDGSQEGVIADRDGNIYSSLTAGMELRKYAPNRDREWPTYGGDLNSARYSPLDIIGRDNFNDLALAWEFDTRNFGPFPEYNFQSTPLMVNRVLYTTAGSRRDVAALDARTGELLWMHRVDEGERGDSAPRRLSGRGLAFWDDGTESGRILYVTPGYQLIALDAATGHRIESFGIGGIVDLKQEMDQELDPVTGEVGLHAAPIVADGVIVIGAAHLGGRAPTSMTKPKGHVRGYDARTGNRLWIFHTIPMADEYGNDTWLNNSWSYTGYTGAWAQMSADEELGLVYVPTEVPTGDYYGGHRHGDNLFANSILALDLHTGERQWHFQTIHHDIWDWDLASAPILVDLNIEGARREALVQVTKQGLTFTFDKRTGEPLFEIEERPVAASDVPGERASPTQPFPVKPPPFGRHGISLDDLIDFTPELKAQAIAVASNYRLGPIYTPASLADADDGTLGTIQLPRGNGGSNWPGGAVDPETGILYIFYKSTPQVLSMAPSPRSDMNYVNLANRRTVPLIVDGLPLVKPPWGQISAIDMNEGEILWQVAHGETPDNVRNHPALQGMDIPRTGQAGFIGILVTKTLAIAGDGGTYTNEEGRTVAMLRAYDKSTGAELGAVEMPGRASGSPMTYEIDGVQYLAVAVSGPNLPGRLMVFSYAGSDR